MSDIDIRSMVEALRPLGRQARATMALSEKLEALVGLEDFGKELTARVEALKSEVATAEGKVARAGAKAVAVCADAKAKAEKVLSDASEAAERCIADAEEEAKAVVSEAREAAEVSKAENELARSTGRILQAEVDSLATKRDGLRDEIENLRAVAGRIIG